MGKFKTGLICFGSSLCENKTGRIQSCIQYLVDLNCLLQVKSSSHDVSQLMKLLHMVRAIVSNTSLYLEPQSCVSAAESYINL